MTIIKKFDPEVVNKKFPRKYLVLIAAGIFFLLLIEIWAVNNASTYGKKFDEMSALGGVLRMENQILENEIARESALTSLATRAAELGFLKPQSIQYIR